MPSSRPPQFLVLPAKPGTSVPGSVVAALFARGALTASGYRMLIRLGPAAALIPGALLLWTMSHLSPQMELLMAGLFTTAAGFYFAPSLLAQNWPFPLRVSEVAGLAALSYGLIVVFAAVAIITQTSGNC